MNIFNKKPKEVVPAGFQGIDYSHLSVLFVNDQGYLHISVTGDSVFTPEQLEELKNDVNALVDKYNKKLNEGKR